MPVEMPVASADEVSAQAFSAQQQSCHVPSRKKPSDKLRFGNELQRSKRVRDVEKVRELEALAALKIAQLEILVAHNTQLKYRHGVLTHALELRDYTLRVMTATDSSCATQLPSWAMTLPHTFPPSCPWDSTAAAAAGGGTQEQRERAVVPGARGDGAGAPAAGSVAAAVWAPGSVALLLPLGLQPPLDRERLARIGRSELVCAWQRFLSSASTHLLALEERHGDEGAAEGLLAAEADMTRLFKHVDLLAPDTFLLVQQTHLETGELSAPDPQHWEAVVGAMELTEKQCRELQTVYELFTKVLSGIHAERQAIKRRLAEGLALNPTAACPPCGPGAGQGQGPACSMGAGCAAGAPSAAADFPLGLEGDVPSPAVSLGRLSSRGLSPATSLPLRPDCMAGAGAAAGLGGGWGCKPEPRADGDMGCGAGCGGGGRPLGGSCSEASMTRLLLRWSSAVPPEQEVLPALQRSMRQEKTAHLLLRGFLMGRVLSIVQVARMAVKAYPWFPNFSAVVATVGEMAPGELGLRAECQDTVPAERAGGHDHGSGVGGGAAAAASAACRVGPFA